MIERGREGDGRRGRGNGAVRIAPGHGRGRRVDRALAVTGIEPARDGSRRRARDSRSRAPTHALSFPESVFSSPFSFGGGLRVASDDAAGGLRLEGHLPGDRDVERAVGGEGGSDRERGSAGDGRGDASRRGSGADTANARDPLRTR